MVVSVLSRSGFTFDMLFKGFPLRQQFFVLIVVKALYFVVWIYFTAADFVLNLLHICVPWGQTL